MVLVLSQSARVAVELNGLTLESWIANYDWEEPVVQNSEWHHRRTGIISDLFSDDFAKFCVCLVTFYFGSDEWLAALRSHKTKLRDVNDPSCDSKNLAWFYEAAIRGCKGNPFHKRYNPQRIRANEWERVARHAGADLATFETLEMVWDDFSEEEAMEVPEAQAVVPANWQLTHMLIVQRAVQWLPTLAGAKKVFAELCGAKDEEEKWAAIQKLPGLGGTGYAAKNLSLLLRDTVQATRDLGLRYSAGGSGPRQCYNLQAGLPRKSVMSAATLQTWVSRDLLAAGNYWSGNYFGAAWPQMTKEEQKIPHAVAITSFRCALDKNMWKVFLAVDPPAGFTSCPWFALGLR